MLSTVETAELLYLNFTANTAPLGSSLHATNVTDLLVVGSILLTHP